MVTHLKLDTVFRSSDERRRVKGVFRVIGLVVDPLNFNFQKQGGTKHIQKRLRIVKV